MFYRYTRSKYYEMAVVSNNLLKYKKICGMSTSQHWKKNGHRTNMTNRIGRNIWSRCWLIWKYMYKNFHYFKGTFNIFGILIWGNIKLTIKDKRSFFCLTWFLRYHFAFFPLCDSLQVKDISSQVPCLMLRSWGSSIHSNFS